MALNVPPIPIQGLVIAATAEDYSVTDRDTGQVNRGTTRKIFVTSGFDEAPTEIRFKGNDDQAVADFAKIQAAGQFATINATAKIAQYGGREAFIQHASLQAVEPAKAGR